MARISQLGATVTRVPSADELPALVARIARLWAEIRLADEALALELLQRLPAMDIEIADAKPGRNQGSAKRRR